MKNKSIILLSVIMVCLMSSCLYTEAYYTTIEGVTYPETAIIGKTFEITVNFDYAYDSCSLYGDYVYLYYAVGLNPIVDFTSEQYFAVSIKDLDNAPTPNPSSVVIEVDTGVFNCEINDTFRFRIRFRQGLYFESSGNYYDVGTVTSDNYDLMLIENPNKISFFLISIPIALLFLCVVFVVQKQKKRKIGDMR